MINKFVTVFLFFLIPIIGKSQSDYRVSYHPLINQAELAIVDSNYRLALEYYKRVFKWVEPGFARDYHNAALCAIELDEFETAIDLLKKLVTKGVDKSYFINNLHLYEKLYGHGLKEFLSSFDEQREKTFETTVNKQLYGVLGKLANDDQEFRYDIATYRDTIQKIDARNISKFLELVDEYGFPSEETLGIDSPNSNSPIFHILIWHHIKNWKFDKFLFDIRPLVRSAVADGLLHPEHAGAFFNLAAARFGGYGNYGDVTLMQFNDDPKFYISNYQYPGLTDNIREELGLYNTADFEKKARFHFITTKKRSKFRVLYLSTIDTYPAEAKDKIHVKELK